MSRRIRIGFLALLIAVCLSPQRASAQYQRTAGDLEGFRARLTIYMQQLQKLQPSRVPPDVIESIGRLDSRQLEILQNAFPSNERFWSTPTVLADFLEKSGTGVPSAAGPAFTETALGTAQSLSTSWKAGTLGNPPPKINSFGLNDPKTIREGETFSFAYDVSSFGSGTHLKTLVLWRALDRNGAPDEPTWVSIGSWTVPAGRDHDSGNLTYSPQASGVFWWGLHVIDTDGGEVNENSDPSHPMTVKGIVQFDPTKKCPSGFNYEALWLSRDAETVCEIAKELIPEDVITTVPYTIAAVAWSVSKGLRFSVEQVYQRWADCENDKTFTKIDDTITSRASQKTADDIWGKVGGLDLSNLDAKLSSRSDKTTTDNIWGKVQSLDLSNLDAKLSSRSDKTTTDNIWGKVQNLDAAKVDATITSRSDKATTDNIWGKVDKLDATKLDATITSRSDKTTTDNIWGKVDKLNAVNLDATISSRASEASLITTGNTLGGAIATSANNLGGAIAASTNTLGGAIDNVQKTVNTLDSSKASQASVNEVANTLRIQERLDLQVIMIEPTKRYLVEVTKRGAPAAGLTVQQLQAFTMDKTGILIGLTPTFTVKKLPPASSTSASPFRARRRSRLSRSS